MNIWTFDLSINTGVAQGHPPADLSRLHSRSYRLRTAKFDDPLDDLAHIILNFETLLDDLLRWKDDWPDKVIFEAPLDPNWRPRDGRARGALEMMLPSNMATELKTKCMKEGIPCEKVYPATVRAKFIDKANAGERQDTKKAIIKRCQEWGYLPTDCKDDNRADAVAMWHWAQRQYGKWTPPYEIMFGTRVAIVGAKMAGA